MIFTQNGVLVAEFGTGDILISSGSSKGIGIMSLTQHKPSKIGSSSGVSDSFIKENCIMCMSFSNIESIDVMIRGLENIKRRVTK